MAFWPKGYKKSDQAIWEDVCEALTRDENVDATEISVSVKKGVVTLSGRVIDRGMKHQAEEETLGIRGVEDVKNEIHVVTECDRKINTAITTGVY